MHISEIREKIEKILQEAKDQVSHGNPELNEQLKLKYLGRKGELSQIMKSIGRLDHHLRPEAGKLANYAKQKLEKIFSSVGKVRKPIVRRFDPTLPGRSLPVGGMHPLKRVLRESIEIFVSMGFSVVGGPEIETDYYNFDALNTPEDHPARDIQDTFYIKKPKWLLRTQTSPVQIRVMESQPPPVKIIAPGRCYRKDAIDATHYYAFTQIEGLYVDRDVTLADLKGILTGYAKIIIGEDTEIRFRPHFFPFTEPSVEYDFSCPSCHGAGCRICKGSGWFEISGAGMVSPKVLRTVGYDPNVFQGYAWGMGVERITMVKYGIEDIRLLFENDLAFLEQF